MIRHSPSALKPWLVVERLPIKNRWLYPPVTTQLHLPIPNYETYRPYSNPSGRPSLWGRFMDNVKQEMAKNKEMKESLKKFREEREKLEQSDALRKARQKFESVESEATKSTEVLKGKIGALKGKVQEAMGEVGKTEFAKKAGQITDDLGKSAKEAAEKLSEQGQTIGKSGAFKTVTEAAEVVKKELDSGYRGNVYQAPTELRKRRETGDSEDLKPVEPNTEALGMELHKDSKFYQSWQNFKDNNQYINKVLDWKMKYDESDNPLVRASRAVTERVTDIMGGLFQKTELSETLTEICKVDPNFDRLQFLRHCETDIIPNILEAMVRGDLEILKDWCHEGPFNILSTPIKQAQKMGARFDSKVLDIKDVDLTMGKMMDQGPVLVISFQSQQIMCLRDAKGAVLEGDPEKVLRVMYVWVLCRDMSELDPKAAWRLLDLSAHSTEQLL
ncbi:mitochondrial import inner membrane translocase subunit TIM44 isoform X2 [Thrips palmi]|uniref:Mitochondrial import inner membrane translocase subunit TIM44 n=1 Tax=Thrips palmi TaxID=161013 RepID=A0A6P8Z0V0_THRPL|nr:mitochondrial import inner membrane translocase subunit TIM44 isoform X2 [Thrips palmi]